VVDAREPSLDWAYLKESKCHQFQGIVVIQFDQKPSALKFNYAVLGWHLFVSRMTSLALLSSLMPRNTG
jgi:hypothetical protein